MAQQEEGWPLGLHPLNVRIGLGRNPDFSGSISINTLISASPTSFSDSSSDLDTQSTGSFFHDKSITLGSLIGVSTILERSRRSGRGRRRQQEPSKTTNCKKKPHNKPSRAWIFSLCPNHSTDGDSVGGDGGGGGASSLGHFLEAERRAVASSTEYGPDDAAAAAEALMGPNNNSLFVDGTVAPPPWAGGDGTAARREESGVSLLFSCVCGHPVH